MKFTEKYGKDTEVRALSWKQPFASLMLHAKVETRVWGTKYRGWVLICASKAPYSHAQVQDISGEEQWKRITDTLGFEFKSSVHVPLGKAIAIGKLSASQQLNNFKFYQVMLNKHYKKKVENNCFVKYNANLWGHFYDEVQPIVPFEWSGVQGWKTIDEETKSKIILL